MLPLPRALALVLFLASPIASADLVRVGSGSYRTDLPAGSDGKPRRSIDPSPLISPRITGAIPTNDWWSSLVWPMHSPHSMAMFPHPLAVQAHADGLGIGYTSTPVISDHLKDGKVFQTGTEYRYPFRQSLLVGLDGIETKATVLDDFSDWAVTALWKADGDELRATIAHGSPFVYFDKQSDRPIRIKFSAAKVDRTREPIDPYTVEWNGINARHNGRPGAIRLSVNAGASPGIGSKARIVYDFDGDGESDRTETFQLFATDPVPGSWEIYSSENQGIDPGTTRGEMQDFTNGTVRLEFWKCFGEGALELNPSASQVELPDGTTRPLGEAASASVGAGDQRTGAAKVFHDGGQTLGLTINGSHFGIFAPLGSELAIEDDTLVSGLGGKSYFSVAALPDSAPATLERFKEFAFAFLRDTRISYRYDPGSASVTTTYTAKTEAMEGSATGTLFALYRHQHLHTTEPDRFEKFTYASPRGEMKVMAGESFSTRIPFLGVLPALPNARGGAGQLSALLENEAAGFRFTKDDTYWNGKEFGKVTELIQIAQQLGSTDIRDQLLTLLKAQRRRATPAPSGCWLARRATSMPSIVTRTRR